MLPSSTFAAMPCKIGFTKGHASFDPPGMMDGPVRAPSSPPDTPVPINNKPFSFKYCVRLVVS